MTKLTNLDVLIVYSEALAKSASNKSEKNIAPFPRRSKNSSYNDVYGYFLDNCAKLNLKAAFTTSADIIGPGFCSSYWKFDDEKWSKVNQPCFSPLIFDKFSPTRSDLVSRRQLLFSGNNVRPFNDSELFNLFFDKQLTYEKLSSFSIPTVALKGHSLEEVNDACRALTILMDRSPNSADFSTDLIMKDRFGAGGRHVYKFKANQPSQMYDVVNKNSQISFILQPFAKFDKGFTYNNCPASTDIRLIYLNGEIINSYIRMAKTGDFRCNQHQGGSLSYLPLSDIPLSLVEKSNSISSYLNKKNSFYTLDFIITNEGNSYLLEGNTGPGLNWEKTCQQDEFESKKLIRLVVSELASRTVQSGKIN